MICDVLDNADLYASVHPLLGRALDFARQFDPATAEGRIDIEGDDLYAMVVSYDTSPADERLFEAHKRYIDVQILLQGSERLDVAFTGGTVTKPYEDDSDAILFGDALEFSSLVLTPGTFAILFPHDIHRPGCDVHNAEGVRKLVLKLRCSA